MHQRGVSMQENQTCDKGNPMTSHDDWLQYLLRHTRDWTPKMKQRQLAEIWAVDEATVSRWMGGAPPDWDAIVKVARRLGRLPTEAMLHAGKLELDDVEGTIFVHQPTSELSRFQLVDELSSRLERLDEMTQITNVDLSLVQEEPPGDDV